MRSLGRALLLFLLVAVNLFADKLGEQLSLKQEISKDSLYVGEPVTLSYIFRYKSSLKLSEVNFHPPSFKGFWAKKEKKTPTKVDGNFTTYRMNFILYPQQSGELKIGKGRLNVGVLYKHKKGYYSFGNIRWKSLSTKPVRVDVKPLPDGVEVFGDFHFSLKSDKNITTPNKPVTINVRIEGVGNVDVIDAFKLDMPECTVYDEAPQRASQFKDGENLGLFRQKFVILCDKSYTIKPIEFRYFDSKTHKVKTLYSKPLHIEVKNGKNEVSTKEQPPKEPKESSKNGEMLFGVVGFLFGLVTMYLLSKLWRRGRFQKRNERTEIHEKLKRCKSDKDFLNALLPYIGVSTKLDIVIKDLEANVFQGDKRKIDKKQLVKEFDQFLVGDREEEILK